MVKVGFVNRSPDIKIPFNKAVVPVTKTLNSSMRANRNIVHRRRRKEIADRSYLPALRDIWANMDDDTKATWVAAAAVDGRSAWFFFVSETSARWKSGQTGVTYITDFHAGLVGHIEIGGSATGVLLQQDHNFQHKRMIRVVGSQTQKVPIIVNEILTVPFTIGLSYRSNLTAAGPNPYARLYARVTTAYKGGNPPTEVECILALVSGWASSESTLDALVGVPRHYSLGLELRDCVGTLEFDYVRAEHSGTNFAFDFRCDDISHGFSNTNYKLPPPWSPVDLQPGVTFSSIYPSDSSL